MMTETHINSNHMLNSGLGPKANLEKMEDEGWKAKLKIPPKDKRIKTSVSISQIFFFFRSIRSCSTIKIFKRLNSFRF